ncbi:hypothetical protein LDFHOB_12000 [Candidatus Electronema aureum]
MAANRRCRQFCGIDSYEFRARQSSSLREKMTGAEAVALVRAFLELMEGKVLSGAAALE